MLSQPMYAMLALSPELVWLGLIVIVPSGISSAQVSIDDR